MGTFLRFFNLNDANKPPEDASPQAAPDSGERSSLNGKTLAAGKAGSNGTGDAEMAQPGLLETVAGTAGCSSDEKGTEARSTSGLHALTGVDQRQSVAGAADEDEEVEEAEEQDEDEAPVQVGELVGLADFEVLFQRYQTPIINFVFRLVGNREQAYDLAQDVFVKAYKALAGGTKIHAGALSSWLYRIAANTATDALRRKRLIAWLPLSLFNEDRGVGGAGESGGSGTEEGFPGAVSLYDGGSYNGGRFEQRVADREIVDAVLSKLPEKYAVCLLLYEHEGFSCNEIADILKVSPSAVKMRLMRARERFIALYQQEVDGP
jgi:RNA polymerase sigma-70 factor (ECF subfamily)